MRTFCLLVAGGLGLLLASCGNSGPARTDTVTPVSKYKEMIVGKWEAEGGEQLVQVYEFAPDGKVKVTFKGMKEPVPGNYTWTGDRELTFEYQATEEAKKGFADSVKAYKEPMRKQAQGGGPIGDAMKKSLDAMPDELPAKEKVTTILGDKPHDVLIITLQQGLTLNFNRAKGG
jgi:hypothetical protein